MSDSDDASDNEDDGPDGWVGNTTKLTNGKISRLVDWNVDVLTRLLKLIVAKNHVLKNPVEITPSSPGWARDVSDGKTVLDEVKETIALPPFHAKMVHLQDAADRIELDPEVKSQLREFVSNIAAMYHDNPCKFIFKCLLRQCESSS